jgi:hypothetical protein
VQQTLRLADILARLQIVLIGWQRSLLSWAIHAG